MASTKVRRELRYDGRGRAVDDAPRYGVKRLRIRGEARTPTSIPGVGSLVGPGEFEAIIYADELVKVKDRVETDSEMIEEAKAVHERKFAEFAASARRANPGFTEAQMRRQYTGSLESEYYSIRRRGIKPLYSVEVLEELPALDAPDSDRLIRQLAEQIGAGSASSKDDLTDLVRSMGDKISELEAKLAAVDSPKKGGRPRKSASAG